jgi:hypothetical protein
MMRTFKQWLFLGVFVALGLAVGGCGGAKVSPAVQEAITAKTPMYTQTGMWYETKKIVYGTNYNVGVHIPVNSKVTVVGAAGHGVVIDYKGVQVELRNIGKYTGLDDGQFVDRLLGSKPVDLSKFSAAERTAIGKGALEKGMSRDAVLVSRGYPPAHATPSLKDERWRYWKNRWATMYVVFTNGKVSGFVE